MYRKQPYLWEKKRISSKLWIRRLKLLGCWTSQYIKAACSASPFSSKDIQNCSQVHHHLYEQDGNDRLDWQENNYPKKKREKEKIKKRQQVGRRWNLLLNVNKISKLVADTQGKDTQATSMEPMAGRLNNFMFLGISVTGETARVIATYITTPWQ